MKSSCLHDYCLWVFISKYKSKEEINYGYELACNVFATTASSRSQ